MHNHGHIKRRVLVKCLGMVKVSMMLLASDSDVDDEV